MWRREEGPAVMLSIEEAGVLDLTIGVPERPRLDTIMHQSLLVGLEYPPAKAGAGLLIQGGFGVGRVITGRPREMRAGLAFGGAVGSRVVSPARQLGFAVALRGGGVVAGNARWSGIALALGIIVHPR
jgi:hypothetical protein